MSEKLRILWINPVGTERDDHNIRNILNSIKRPDVEVDVTHLRRGPVHLEYHFYEHIVLDEVLRLIRKAEQNEYDAVVIGCFYDPGLREARELVKIPIVALAETCMHVAATLGHKFSVIVGRKKSIPKMEDNVYLYGLEKKLASFRSIDFTVIKMATERKELEEVIYQQSEKAIKKDGAEVIVLGCAVASGFAEALMSRLKVPVVDPVMVSFKYAELLADLYVKIGLSHSKVYGYEPPPKEEGWLADPPMG